MPRRLDAREPGFEAAFAELLAAKRETEVDVARVVAEILAEVRARGDPALIDDTERFDRIRLTPETRRIPEVEVAAAAAHSASGMRRVSGVRRMRSKRSV